MEKTTQSFIDKVNYAKSYFGVGNKSVTIATCQNFVAIERNGTVHYLYLENCGNGVWASYNENLNVLAVGVDYGEIVVYI